jgi:ankyrin repeat protein
MIRAAATLACLLSCALLLADDAKPTLPSFDYDAAQAHEIKPHRRTIPVDGVREGFNQLRLTLTVTPAGDVTKAEAGGQPSSLKYWPQLQGEIYQWKFTPFEKDGKPVTAEIEEYIDLVPPERLPKTHVTPPTLRPDSKVSITLRRSGCFGSCPSYTVKVSTEGIFFDGNGYVVASGKHTDSVEAASVRKLAQKFIDADFYSMDPIYRAMVTDNPTYELDISIDGKEWKVQDYVGQWEGMPAVIPELEEEVDTFAHTDWWIAGADGLVHALRGENYNFKTSEAQVILKEAASRGQAKTVQEMLEAGVPLTPLPYMSKTPPMEMTPSIGTVGWLNAASSHPEVLQLLIEAGASKDDQTDKDLALAGAAGSGSLQAVRALISYGASPNADLSKLTITTANGGMTMQGPGSGSILIEAAHSGNPDVIREILRYHPKLELLDHEGQTAMFAVGDYRDSDADGASVECVRLLAEAGANVNARDKSGNTPLHETFLTDVEEELLKLGADVNARNDDGETPIFTTVDDDAIPVFIQHGADLSIRNKKGQTVVEAAKDKGPQRQEALRKAIQEFNQTKPSP